MRFVKADARIEMDAVVHAVSKNLDSWKGWQCIRIEILLHGPASARQTVAAGIESILKMHLEDRQGTAYIDASGVIDIVCKDLTHKTLETMGMQLVEFAKDAAGAAAMYRIFDLETDSDAFIAAHRENRRDNDMAHAISDSGAFTLRLPQSKSDNLRAVSGIKVLLVEDDPVTRWMVKMALRDECRLTVAPDAGKALAAYRQNRPDLVLLDINLPGHDGHEIMTRIMNADPGAHIVMFSSNDTLENIVGCMASGAKGFIAKPFDRNRLVGCIRENSPSRQG